MRSQKKGNHDGHENKIQDQADTKLKGKKKFNESIGEM